MRYKEREHGLAFMSWGQNPMKRNINKTVKVNINNDIELKVGDILEGSRSITHTSDYTIEEIVSVRPSSMSGKNYVAMKCNHSLNPIHKQL